MSITDREKLLAQARAAAAKQLATGIEEVSPWPEYSDQGVLWRATFDRVIRSDELEGSAA